MLVGDLTKEGPITHFDLGLGYGKGRLCHLIEKGNKNDIHSILHIDHFSKSQSIYPLSPFHGEGAYPEKEMV